MIAVIHIVQLNVAAVKLFNCETNFPVKLHENKQEAEVHRKRKKEKEKGIDVSKRFSQLFWYAWDIFSLRVCCNRI